MFENVWQRALISALLCLFPCTNLYAVSSSTCFDTDAEIMLHTDGADDSTTFTDSGNCPACPKTWTADSGAKIATEQSQFGGASGEFIADNAAITTAAAALWDIDQIFTVDAWVRFQSTASASFTLLSTGSDCGGLDNVQCLLIQLSAGNLNVYLNSNSTAYSNAWAPTLNTWHHIAVTRDGSNNLRVFITGAQLGAAANNANDPDDSVNQMIVGGHGLDGEEWMDEIRLVRGTAIWTADFTPPTGAYTACEGAPPDPQGGAAVGGNLFIF